MDRKARRAKARDLIKRFVKAYDDSSYAVRLREAFMLAQAAYPPVNGGPYDHLEEARLVIVNHDAATTDDYNHVLAELFEALIDGFPEEAGA